MPSSLSGTSAPEERSSSVPAGVSITSCEGTMHSPSRVLSTRPATLPASGPVATAMSLSRPRMCPCESVTGVPSRAVRLTREVVRGCMRRVYRLAAFYGSWRIRLGNCGIAGADMDR